MGVYQSGLSKAFHVSRFAFHVSWSVVECVRLVAALGFARSAPASNWGFSPENSALRGSSSIEVAHFLLRSCLTAGTKLSRQAVTKHLRVLENARVVRSMHRGRESLFELEPRSIEEMRNYLDQVSRQWDDALARLKLQVEE